MKLKNKVLVKIIVPEIDLSFDVFIPINEIMWKVKKMIIKTVSDIVNVNFDLNKKYVIAGNNGKIYKNNELIIDTDIRNASELLLYTM